MRILLVNPSQLKIYGTPMPPVYPPLGLMYIASVLEKDGHTVRLLDIDAEGIYGEDQVELLKEFKPDIVGITSTTPIFSDAIDFAKTVKKTLNVPIMMGGVHPTMRPDECIAKKEIDYVVVGEGEITASELIKAVNSGKKDFSKIDGLVYKKGKKVIKTKPRKLIENLDSLPFPARHLLKRPDVYVPADALHSPITTIISSLGCPGRCTFCCTKKIFGFRIRRRSVEHFISEMEYCIEKFGTKEFHIADDNFTFDKKWALKFCDEVKKRKLGVTFVFFNGLRADYVDKELLQALKDIGVLTVGFGVESGNQRILNIIKKGITLDRVRKTYKIAKEVGLDTWGYFILGLPEETPETIKDTIKFAKELDPDFAKFLILKPYPGSEVFDQLSEKGLIDDYNYDHYGVYTAPVHHLDSMSAEEILKWQKKAIRSFYLRPRKILKYISRINSWSRLKSDINSAIFMLKKAFLKGF